MHGGGRGVRLAMIAAGRKVSQDLALARTALGRGRQPSGRRGGTGGASEPGLPGG